MQLLPTKRTFLLTIACGLVGFVASAYGQQNKRQMPLKQEEDVVRIRTDLVQTGVMVFDKQGRFVDGLQREQFDLSVDGRPQAITFFEQVKAGSRDEETQLAAARGGATDSSENKAPPVERGRTIIFFIDDLHLSLESLGRTRQMLKRFVDKQMRQDDLVAIASTSGRIGFLQQFTDNKSVLRAAADRLTHHPYNVRDMSREGVPMTEYMALTIERRDDSKAFEFYVNECLRFAPKRYPQQACEVEVVNRARMILMQAASVTSNTYDSLKSLMSSSAQLPGRKLVFFISDGFLLDTGPRNADPRGKLNQITDAAQRAGVVIYTIHARGLISGQLDATNDVPFDPNGRLENVSLREIPASQDALHALAADTGGRALRNQNVFDPWVNRILEETSNYYLLAWRPNEEDLASGDFHNIKVSVIGRPDLTVRLPRGFLRANTAASSAGKTKPESEAVKSPPQELREVLAAFYPTSEVPTRLSVTYLDTPEHGVVLTASMQVADRGLVFETLGGKQTAVVDVAGVVLTDKGKQAGSFQTRLNIAPASDARSQQRSDTIYNYRVPIAPGLYQVRVAARDTKSGNVGSATQWIEIPNLNSRQLNLSSLLVGVEEVQATGAKSEGTAMPQVQFSVDHHFARNSRPRFLIFIYNVARDGAGNTRSDVMLQTQILRGGQSILTTQPKKISVPEKDAARIPYGGEISLNSIPAGRYILQITVTDQIAGTSASQQTNITVE